MSGSKLGSGTVAHGSLSTRGDLDEFIITGKVLVELVSFDS